MANNREIRELLDATAYDVDGDKLGNVNEVYINDTSGQPDFVEINHGLFGMGSSLVPLRGHSLNGEELRLAFAKDRIKDAPNVDSDAHLSNEDQADLYRHYGLDNTSNVTEYTRDERRDAGVAGAGVAGAGVAGHEANRTAEFERREDEVVADRDLDRDRTAGLDNDNEIIRSEERLNVDKERVNAGDVRLHKYVVHDTETVEVPVEREEVRVERQPITDADRANYAGGTIGEDEASVTLHEERVVVSKETVPVEKIGLEKEVVRDTETVTEDVAKERIETEGTDFVERVDGTRNPLDRDNDGNVDRDDLRR
ncbi:DUF2382 domain-containing protein [Corynebacterium doosanense]|uniref:Photosystem reaction center subunit H n=1 Tax=Corynebacterium doosanense CAU 212 = DSM 45436 TaxID=558173 RepID=A0A097IIF6_9CORY|nr:PRC and DUF2382 domain-containing protein [Corynebacterium doosanense]AIT61908.1 photosystem reaction center subunit H [Corynebacterium doosanense CAU 212 = DSM 45436]